MSVKEKAKEESTRNELHGVRSGVMGITAPGLRRRAGVARSAWGTSESESQQEEGRAGDREERAASGLSVALSLSFSHVDSRPKENKINLTAVLGSLLFIKIWMIVKHEV